MNTYNINHMTPDRIVSRKLKLGLFLSAFLFAVGSLSAAPDWYADPDASGASWDDYFKNFNREDSGGTTPTASVQTDSNYGKVWRIIKPAGAKRAEFSRPEVGGSDFNFQDGQTYYIGFRTKFYVQNSEPREDEEISAFQWKTEGNGLQNYPFNMEWNPGTEKLSLNLFGPGTTSQSSRRVKAWEGSVKDSQWVTIVIGFKYSSDANSAYVSLWKNGSKQVLGNLETGSKYSITKFSSDKKKAYHKTKDTGYNYAKWGVYNENSRPYRIYNYLSDLRIDTSYSVARPQ